MREPWITCRGKMLTGSRTRVRERSMLQSFKVKELRDLKNVFSAGILSCFVQYFFTMLLSLYFGTVMYILCHDMLEVCDLFLSFGFLGGLQSKDCMNLRRDFELCVFEHSLIVETVIDFVDS